jgi:hypothetical protein
VAAASAVLVTVLKKPKRLNASQILMAQPILIGGEVMSRQEAMTMLQAEGVHRLAIDWCVFGAPALSEEDLRGFARNGLVLALRLRILALNEQRESEEKQ